MYLWKPLLAILPAGLALGAVGGHMAKPVLTQRVGDEPWQAMFQSRGTSTGTHDAYQPPIEGPMNYDGGLSYAPGWAKYDDNVGVPLPGENTFAYYDTKLPTVAELDVHQAALLADPDKQYTSQQARDQDALARDDVQLAAAGPPQASDGPKVVTFPTASAADSAPEPSRADGEPAIW